MSELPDAVPSEAAALPDVVSLPGLPERVTIWEVGARDGLQNEPGIMRHKREGRVHRTARGRGSPDRRGDIVRAS
ncbi:MAG: hypothetical protein V9E98_03810 [Candidatus Nanopelagicales bacterium]